ncbi:MULTISPECIES: DUF6230 family protein [unclassified Haladaptatus]|uniref:DUF6230 family protein n=1 Tax=unclassified Haladaptatus TaxID=2622732 RepID=UPI00209BF4F3|nr:MULTISPECIES: DUF6230 family protein [unclassified Haladaptatus]MCO8246475.1 DUF6230 family protein [Haladaptatus sp. AB643]MCO8254712.1 DUF6230 family protein [Haladaptatus sp. AB618]
MAINTKKFAIVIGAALVLQAATVGAIATGGTAIAVPTAGVGGFTVTFDQLEGQGFTQYASLENSSECGTYPSAVAKINQGSIKGLKMYKDVEIPKGMPGGGTTVRLMISSDKTVKFRGMTQKFTYLQGNLKMENQKTLSDPNSMKSSFSLSAPTIVIDDGRIKAQSQFLQSITLSGAHVKTVVNPKNTTSFPKSQCAAGGN